MCWFRILFEPHLEGITFDINRTQHDEIYLIEKRKIFFCEKFRFDLALVPLLLRPHLLERENGRKKRRGVLEKRRGEGEESPRHFDTAEGRDGRRRTKGKKCNFRASGGKKRKGRDGPRKFSFSSSSSAGKRQQEKLLFPPRPPTGSRIFLPSFIFSVSLWENKQKGSF